MSLGAIRIELALQARLFLRGEPARIGRAVGEHAKDDKTEQRSRETLE